MHARTYARTNARTHVRNKFKHAYMVRHQNPDIMNNLFKQNPIRQNIKITKKFCISGIFLE